MDHIHKARFAKFHKHLELIARFECHVLFDRYLLGHVSFHHQCLKGPDKVDVVVVWGLCLCRAQQSRDHQGQDHHPEANGPSTQMHSVISDKKSPGISAALLPLEVYTIFAIGIRGRVSIIARPLQGRHMESTWIEWVRRLQAIAQNGLTFCKDPFDRERYEQVRRVTEEIL